MEFWHSVDEANDAARKLKQQHDAAAAQARGDSSYLSPDGTDPLLAHELRIARATGRAPAGNPQLN